MRAVFRGIYIMAIPILAGSDVAGYEYTYNSVVYIVFSGSPILEHETLGALFLAVKKTDTMPRPVYMIPVT
jgi:hypothetical protein